MNNRLHFQILSNFTYHPTTTQPSTSIMCRVSFFLIFSSLRYFTILSPHITKRMVSTLNPQIHHNPSLRFLSMHIQVLSIVLVTRVSPWLDMWNLARLGIVHVCIHSSSYIFILFSFIFLIFIKLDLLGFCFLEGTSLSIMIMLVR